MYLGIQAHFDQHLGYLLPPVQSTYKGLSDEPNVQDSNVISQTLYIKIDPDNLSRQPVSNNDEDGSEYYSYGWPSEADEYFDQELPSYQASEMAPLARSPTSMWDEIRAPVNIPLLPPRPLR